MRAPPAPRAARRNDDEHRTRPLRSERPPPGHPPHGVDRRGRDRGDLHRLLHPRGGAGMSAHDQPETIEARGWSRRGWKIAAGFFLFGFALVPIYNIACEHVLGIKLDNEAEASSSVDA